jgi:hypothetical protein
MRILSFVTESHEDMLSRFVVNRLELAGFTNSDELQIVYGKQVCESGEYGSSGFNECMLDKLQALADVPIGEKCFYVDADVIILPGCKQILDAIILQTDSIAFQWDDGQLCMGMIYWTQTIATRDWWRFIKEYAMVRGLMDQSAMHQLILGAKWLPVNLVALPTRVFGNWSHDRKDKTLWSEEVFALPVPCVAWHANFTIGLANKWKMLEHVEKIACI